MNMSSKQDPINVLPLLQSMRMFLEEFEQRYDIDEIRAAESALWSVAMDAETRRNKAQPVKCPRVTRIEQ